MPYNFIPKLRLPGIDIAEAIQEVTATKKSDGSERLYDHQLVRTDCNQTKLDLFLHNQSNKTSTPIPQNASVSADKLFSTVSDNEKPESSTCSEGGLYSLSSVNKENVVPTNVEEFVPGEKSVKLEEFVLKSDPKKQAASTPKKQPIYLSSVLSLQEDICKARHEGAVELLKELKFVGIANSRFALAQVKTKLHLFDFAKLSGALFYQKVIFDFKNFDVFKFSEPAPIFDLVMIALEDPASSWNPDHGPKDELATFAVDLLVSKREMLEEYFSVLITESSELAGLPILVEQYCPLLHLIPMFLLRTATEVNWDVEKECFHTIALELATLYTMRPIETDDASSSTQSSVVQPDPNVPDWKFTTEHILFPQFKSFFIPDKTVTTNGSILQVADLHDLYKVFERC